jgi:hypothetical protein
VLVGGRAEVVLPGQVSRRGGRRRRGWRSSCGRVLLGEAGTRTAGECWSTSVVPVMEVSGFDMAELIRRAGLGDEEILGCNVGPSSLALVGCGSEIVLPG